jgi:probable rRNA maturation factor
MGAEELVRTAIHRTLNLESGLKETGLTLLFTDEQEIQRLNSTYLGEEKTTDVLSFPSGSSTPGTEGYLGDIAICVPVAQSQADNAGYPLEVELQLLAIHATLHLLGFDHSGSQDKQEMWRAQTRVLTDLGIQYATPP